MHLKSFLLTMSAYGLSPDTAIGQIASRNFEQNTPLAVMKWSIKEKNGAIWLMTVPFKKAWM